MRVEGGIWVARKVVRESGMARWRGAMVEDGERCERAVEIFFFFLCLFFPSMWWYCGSCGFGDLEIRRAGLFSITCRW